MAYHLSWILACSQDEKLRNGQEALRLAEEFCRMTKNHQPLALDTLAAAYAENGRYDEAVSSAQKALKLVLKQGPEELVLGLKQRLKLYQDKTPYRQAAAIEGNS
jgi:tetratricopeptide (TPR) repeat protein